MIASYHHCDSLPSSCHRPAPQVCSPSQGGGGSRSTAETGIQGAPACSGDDEAGSCVLAPLPGNSVRDDEANVSSQRWPHWIPDRHSTVAKYGAADEAPGPQLFLRTMLRPGDWAEHRLSALAARAAAAGAAAARTADYRRWEVPPLIRCHERLASPVCLATRRGTTLLEFPLCVQRLLLHILIGDGQRCAQRATCHVGRRTEAAIQSRSSIARHGCSSPDCRLRGCTWPSRPLNFDDLKLTLVRRGP